MSRYIISPVAGQPNKCKIFDTKKQRHLKSSFGCDTFIKMVAESKASRLNAEDLAKKIGRSSK